MSTLQKLQKLQAQVLTTIEILKEQSLDYYGVAPEMKISYDLESVRTLGSANYHKGVMRLNKHLLLEFGMTYINEVVVHEYAHFVVSARREKGHYNGWPKPHGREFKAVCSFFGIVGRATTNAFSNSEFLRSKEQKLNARKKVFYYSCGCGIPRELTTVRHNKIQRGRATYSCRTCGQTLKFQKQASKLIA